LRPTGPNDEIGALAMRCVSYFDALRAPLTADELNKRRDALLGERQEGLLARWGYPYTEEEYRFHMTLTDSLSALDDTTIGAIWNAAEAQFAAARAAEPLTIDALAIFREERPGAPFSAWRRFPFDGAHSALPASGRLFFFVGPSGAGKDSLLQWVKERLPASADIVFPQRTITRPAHPSEAHEAVDEQTFLRLAAGGYFSMLWQAGGLYYGVRRSLEADLMAGRDVFVNGSREYVPHLREAFPDTRVIWLEADASLIHDRIAMRGRETGAALLRRFDRIKQFSPPQDGQIFRIENNGPIESAGARLLEILCADRTRCQSVVV
jgi:phosphonate metabolism protein PhnN/1,5-bisphosphokinase (PRPP-forming)